MATDQQKTQPPSNLQIALLIEELAKDDIQIRMNAMRQLAVIASALGPVRTRQELLPYLKEMIDDDDDVLYIMCEELLTLMPLVGGAEHLEVLLAPFECLCVVEETKTREKAIECTKTVLNNMTRIDSAFKMVKRFCQSDWHTARMSGASLIPSIYPRVGQKEKDELFQMFECLAGDSMPMVRRSTAASTAELIRGFDESERKELKEVFKRSIAVFQRLSKDEQDSVRLRCVQTLAEMSDIIPPAQAKTLNLTTIIRSFCLDSSWRVRYTVSDKFKEVALMCDNELRQGKVLDMYVKMLRDDEGEVRAKAVTRLADILELIGETNFTYKVIPVLEDLVKDDSKYTRAAFACVIMSLFKNLSKEVVIEMILPHVLKLLKDQDPTVRLNVISNIDKSESNLDVRYLYQAVHPSIKELALDRNWRIRLGVIEQAPQLARTIGKEFFEPPMGGLILSWLRDEVATVREAAAKNLKLLSEIFGPKWACSVLIPKVHETCCTQSKTYMVRITAINAYVHISSLLSAKESQVLVQHIVRLCGDPVPNVRLRACQALKLFHERSCIDDYESVNAAVKACVKDPDTDVRFFAMEALNLMMNVT